MAEEIEQQGGDPFKEFGGSSVSKSTNKSVNNPFAEFGGSIVSSEKKSWWDLRKSFTIHFGSYSITIIFSRL